MKRLFVTGTFFVLIVVAILFSGCAGTNGASSYSVDKNGFLSVTCVPVTFTEQILVSNETYTKSRLVMHTGEGDVVAYLSAPKQPKATMVYSPGAGEKITGHEERMVQYA